MILQIKLQDNQEYSHIHNEILAILFTIVSKINSMAPYFAQVILHGPRGLFLSATF